MTQLRVPGPTPCPPEVMQAMAWPMVNHRGPEFHQMLYDVTEGLKKVFQTKNDVLILTGSGTGGLEAVVVNMLSPGDQVLPTICRVTLLSKESTWGFESLSHYGEALERQPTGYHAPSPQANRRPSLDFSTSET